MLFVFLLGLLFIVLGWMVWIEVLVGDGVVGVCEGVGM